MRRRRSGAHPQAWDKAGHVRALTSKWERSPRLQSLRESVFWLSRRPDCPMTRPRQCGLLLSRRAGKFLLGTQGADRCGAPAAGVAFIVDVPAEIVDLPARLSNEGRVMCIKVAMVGARPLLVLNIYLPAWGRVPGNEIAFCKLLFLGLAPLPKTSLSWAIGIGRRRRIRWAALWLGHLFMAG